VVRYIFGVLFVAIGVVALGWFAFISQFFLWLSPDGDIVPFMMLSLRLCLISLIPLGLALVLYERALVVLVAIDNLINRLDAKQFVIYMLAVGVLLRLAAVALLPFNQYSDFKDYDDMAWQWATRGGYYNGEHLTAYWPPAYPFFLSRIYLVFGHVPRLGAIVNAFLAVPELLLSFIIMKKVFDEKMARWTLTILALFPSQILFTPLLATEALFKPLLLLSILFFLSVDGGSSKRWYTMFIGGIVLGTATLTRAISKYLLAVVIPYWWLEMRNVKRTARFAILALIGFSLVVVPWMIRNYYAVGAAKINTNTGINLFISNQPGAGMGYNTHLARQFDVNDPLQEAYIDSVAWQRAWDYIFEKPGAFLARGVIRVAFFYVYDMDAVMLDMIESANAQKFNYSVVLAVISESYYLIVMLAALMGVWLFFRRDKSLRKPGAYLLFGVVLYWTGVHFVFFSTGRFHFPIIPIFCGFAALFIKSAVENRRGERHVRERETSI